MSGDEPIEFRIRLESETVDEPSDVAGAALEYQPIEAGDSGRHLERGVGAEAAPHHEARTIEPVPVEERERSLPAHGTIGDEMLDRRRPGAAPIAPELEHEQIRADRVVQRGDPVVITDHLPVAVEVDDRWTVGVGLVAPGCDRHPLIDFDDMIGRPGGSRGRIRSGEEDLGAGAATIEERVVGVVGHGRSVVAGALLAP